MDREEIKELVIEKIDQLMDEVKQDFYMAIESKGEVKSYLTELKMYVQNL